MVAPGTRVGSAGNLSLNCRGNRNYAVYRARQLLTHLQGLHSGREEGVTARGWTGIGTDFYTPSFVEFIPQDFLLRYPSLESA